MVHFLNTPSTSKTVTKQLMKTGLLNQFSMAVQAAVSALDIPQHTDLQQTLDAPGKVSSEV